jgi:hypothetical protein
LEIGGYDRSHSLWITLQIYQEEFLLFCIDELLWRQIHMNDLALWVRERMAFIKANCLLTACEWESERPRCRIGPNKLLDVGVNAMESGTCWLGSFRLKRLEVYFSKDTESTRMHPRARETVLLTLTEVFRPDGKLSGGTSPKFFSSSCHNNLPRNQINSLRWLENSESEYPRDVNECLLIICELWISVCMAIQPFEPNHRKRSGRWRGGAGAMPGDFSSSELNRRNCVRNVVAVCWEQIWIGPLPAANTIQKLENADFGPVSLRSTKNLMIWNWKSCYSSI